MIENINQKFKKFNASSLESYISSTMEFPLLTLEEERLLLTKAASGCVDSKGSIISSHLKLVVATAKKYKGYNLPFEDLIQEGNIGLINAVKGYDLESGVRFSSYAMYWIKSAIHEYVMDNAKPLRIVTTKPFRKLFFNLNRMRQSFASADGYVGKLNPEQIMIVSQELSVSEADVIEMETRMTCHTAPIAPEGEDGDEMEPLHPNLVSDIDPLSALEQSRRYMLATHGVSSALEQLDDRSKSIIKSRFFVDVPLSRIDIGEELSISHQRVAQIENVALKKMRNTLSSCYN